MMSENNKIGTYKFVAEPFHVDFTGRLTMGVLGNHLLNCSEDLKKSCLNKKILKKHLTNL